VLQTPVPTVAVYTPTKYVHSTSTHSNSSRKCILNARIHKQEQGLVRDLNAINHCGLEQDNHIIGQGVLPHRETRGA
jgi:hypothetical protein